MIVSEAPCKIILFGEHSVVYGHPAIASAINLKTYTYLKEKNGRTSIYSEALNQKWIYGEKIPKHFEPLEKIFKVIEERYGTDLSRGLDITIKSDTKPGSGLGSSASVATSLTGALLMYVKGKINKEEVNEIAFEAEKVAHGKPSGIDNTVATYGGIIKFVKRANGPKIEKMKLPKDISLYIVDTGLGRSTRDAVQKVYHIFQRERDLVKRIFENIGSIAEKVWNEFVGGRINLERLGRFMNINHGLLNAIGVSNSRIEEIVNYARELGALGAKITGAGLGGFVIILPSEKTKEELYNGLKNRYIHVYNVKIHNDGINVLQE
ncbi:MAG: mevalonate kinase [Candidatus Njordarchaeia archaeon]